MRESYSEAWLLVPLHARCRVIGVQTFSPENVLPYPLSRACTPPSVLRLMTDDF